MSQYASFLDACNKGQLENAQKYYKMENDSSFSFYIELGLANAAKSGALDIMSWIIENYPISDNGYKFAYLRACKFYQLNAVNYLRLRRSMDFVNKDVDILFDVACDDKNLSLVAFIISINPYICFTPDNHFFSACCWKGYYDVVQCMLRNTPKPYITQLVDSNTMKHAFVDCCCQGRMDVAQLIMSMFPNITGSIGSGMQPDTAAYGNITVKVMFRRICANLHLNTAKWFMELYPYIIHFDDDLFYQVWSFVAPRIRGSNIMALEMAEWLVSLKPHLYEIKYNACGAYSYDIVYTKKEANWRKKKDVLWLSSAISPNKQSLLYLIPEDVSRYIISKFL